MVLKQAAQEKKDARRSSRALERQSHSAAVKWGYIPISVN
jgi:hypothetical protein